MALGAAPECRPQLLSQSSAHWKAHNLSFMHAPSLYWPNFCCFEGFFCKGLRTTGGSFPARPPSPSPLPFPLLVLLRPGAWHTPASLAGGHRCVWSVLQDMGDPAASPRFPWKCSAALVSRTGDSSLLLSHSLIRTHTEGPPIAFSESLHISSKFFLNCFIKPKATLPIDLLLCG